MKYIRKFNESNNIDVKDIFQSTIDMLEMPFHYKIRANNSIRFYLQCITSPKYMNFSDQSHLKLNILVDIEHVINKCETVDKYRVHYDINSKETEFTIELF